MPTLDASLVGRGYPSAGPFEVTGPRVADFARAIGSSYDEGDPVPPTYPIVLALEAVNVFLATEQVDLFRIVHGEQRFAYERPVRVGDVLTATMTVASLRRIGGSDVVGTISEVRDRDGGLVCTARATLVHTGESA